MWKYLLRGFLVKNVLKKRYGTSGKKNKNLTNLRKKHYGPSGEKMKN